MTKEQRLIKELTTKVNDLEQLCKDKDCSLRFAQINDIPVAQPTEDM